MKSWYLLLSSTRRKAKPALPRVTNFKLKASFWSVHGPPAWTEAPPGTFMVPPEKVTAPASIVQISFTLSLKLSASQPILIVCSPRSSVASWNVLAPHPTAELRVHVGSTYNG